jgi:hypothetical protein
MSYEVKAICGFLFGWFLVELIRVLWRARR